MGQFHASLYSTDTDFDIESVLGFSVWGCPRYRSVEINALTPEVAVRGRCGDGNRREYEKEIDAFEEKPGFRRSYEWDQDSTYMFFIFEIPKAKHAEWRAIIDKNSSVISVNGHNQKPRCTCDDSSDWTYDEKWQTLVPKSMLSDETSIPKGLLDTLKFMRSHKEQKEKIQVPPSSPLSVGTVTHRVLAPSLPVCQLPQLARCTRSA